MGILGKIFGKKDRLSLKPTSYAPPKLELPKPISVGHGSDPTLSPPKSAFAEPSTPGNIHTPSPFEEQRKANPYNLSMPRDEPVHRPAPSYHGKSSGTLLDKDIALISAKLDTIKSQLESISARLGRLERIAEGESHGQNRW